MDIDSQNFRENRAQIYDAIEMANFIAIDTEFSGLGRDDELQSLSHCDSLSERYRKLASVVKDFGMFQVGFSCFRYDPMNQRYNTSTFSINTIPAKTNGRNPFSSCFNSMRFLAEHGFDFNKLFRHGLPYVDVEDLLTIQNNLPGKIKDRIGLEFLEKDEASLNLQDEDLNLMRKFIRVNSKKLKNDPKICTSGNYRDFLIESADFSIDNLPTTPLNILRFPHKTPKFTNHSAVFNNVSPDRDIPKAIRRQLLREFDNVDVKLGENNSVNIEVFASKKDRDVTVIRDEIDNFNDAIGITGVLLHALSRDVPLVGHNPLWDVLHIFDKCVTPLPTSLAHMRELYSQNVSLLFDTKIMVKRSPFVGELPHTSLRLVYEACLQSSLVAPSSPMVGHQSYTPHDNAADHQAGYDAFMTAIAFATLLNIQNDGFYEWKEPLPIMDLNHHINLTAIFCSEKLNFYEKGVEPETKIFQIKSEENMDYNFVKSFFSRKCSLKSNKKSKKIYYAAALPGDLEFSKEDFKELQKRFKEHNIEISYYNQTKLRQPSDKGDFPIIKRLYKGVPKQIGRLEQEEIENKSSEVNEKIKVVQISKNQLFGKDGQNNFDISPSESMEEGEISANSSEGKELKENHKNKNKKKRKKGNSECSDDSSKFVGKKSKKSRKDSDGNSSVSSNEEKKTSKKKVLKIFNGSAENGEEWA